MIVRVFKRKTPSVENITLSQWMGVSVKSLNALLLRHNMDRKAIQVYLAYIIKVFELIEEHLHTRFLKKRQGILSSHASSAGTRTSKSSTETVICKLYNSPTGCQ